MSTLVAAGLMLQPAFGQSGSGGASGTIPGGTTSVPGSSSTVNLPPPSNSTTTPTNSQPAGQLPIFLSGRVLLEDGTAPPQPAVIERVCNGQPHAEGYTDSKGYFAIQLFQGNGGVMQDASDDMGGGNHSGPIDAIPVHGQPWPTEWVERAEREAQDRTLMGCELRARVAGYRSQSISLASHRPMDPPDVGTILLHQNAPSEGSIVSAVSLAAPKDAHKEFQKGLEALKKNKVEDARKDFTKAIQSYPHYATAWCELGRIQAQGSDAESARKSFDAAAQADPKFVVPYLELAALHLQAHQWPELADISAKAIKLDPFDSPQAFFYNAVANYYLDKMDEAEKSAREAERLDTRHRFPQNYHLLGVLLARHQDYSGAAEQFRLYLKFAPGAADAETVRTQLSQVEKLLSAAKQ